MKTRRGSTPAPLKQVDIIGGEAESGQMAVMSRVAKRMRRDTNCSVTSVSLLSLGGDCCLVEHSDLRVKVGSDSNAFSLGRRRTHVEGGFCD